MTLSMTVAMVTAGKENSYLKMTENIGRAFNRSCWVCMTLPGREGRIPMYGVVALSWTMPSWVKQGKCIFGVGNGLHKGPKFELLVINSTRSVFIDRKHTSEHGVGVGWRNITGIGCSWEYGN